MHKRKLKRKTLTQGTKTVENFSRIKDCSGDRNESGDHFQLPSLQKKTAWKDVEENVSTCNQHSTATDIFCSPEIENIATGKVMRQWEVIENTLYEDGEQATQTAVLEECIQWRTQIPHLRIVGKNPFLSMKTNCQDFAGNYNHIKNSFNSQEEDVASEHSLLLKGRRSLSKQKLQKTQEDEIFEMLYEYVLSELFPNKANEIDSLSDDFNNVLQIRTAPIHSNKSSAKSTKVNWFDEINFDNSFLKSNGKPVENYSTPIRRGSVHISGQVIQKKLDIPTNPDRLRSGKDESAMENKLFRPHTSRNKLGTIFNEKIVVSPVPYVLSTRESFSTVKTTPIKFMAQNFDVSTVPGSSRNINYYKNLGKNSTSAKISNYQSPWHAPVSPAVWPKNIKLAPLDTSRLHNGKNRFPMSSSVILPRNKKPLSPIPRPILPVSAQTVYNNKNEGLEIQGRRISPGQSPKLSMSITRWENAGNSKSIRREIYKK